MPTYEYVCTACGNNWEEVQKITANALEVCPKCGQSTAKRQVSGGSFILKGGGWYSDLYSSTKPASKGGDSGGSSSTGSSSPKESAPAKTETAAPAATPAAAPSGGSGSSSGSKT